jgi:hypothetical protein
MEIAGLRERQLWFHGQSANLHFVVISDNHPANSPGSTSFTVIYDTAQELFDMNNTSYFQPMLQTFKFSS